MNNKKILFVGVVIAILSLVLVACGGSSAGVTVNLKAQDIKFDLKEIKAKANQTVTINYTNEGSLEHTFNIKEFNVKETIPPNSKKTFNFKVTKAGTFDFTCDVPGHVEAGMIGKLIVAP